MSIKEKLKIGLLVDSFEVPAWVESMLTNISMSDYATIDLVILNTTKPRKKNTIIKRFIQNHGRLLYVLYDKLDRVINNVSPDAFASTNLKNLLSEVEVIEVTPRQTKFCDYINDSDLEIIRQHNIDVFVRLGFRILKGDVLQVAKFGIWSYHHADNHENRGGPPGFWEVIDRIPVTGSILQILSDRLDDGLVLSRSFSSTDTLSVLRNRNSFYWKSASLLPRELRSLHNAGEEKYFSEKNYEEGNLTFYTKRLYKEPGNLEFIRKLPGYCLHYFTKRIIQKFTYEDWFLMFKFSSNTEISTSLRQFSTIESPRDRFWADPCVIYESGIYYIFVEEFMYDTQKGHITVFSIDKKGKLGKPQRIIETSYHVSYPFVFEWEGAYFLVLESSENRTIELYRCVDFPTRWVFEKNLMEDVTAVDPTLFEHNGKWWLFVNIRENDGAPKHDELFLYYADTPLSDSWLAYSGNPVVSDVRKARPAGRLFHYNNDIYRPSQDCSIEYGHGLVINKVLELTESCYQENTVQSMTADWRGKLTGIHTLSHAHKLTFIDVKRNKMWWRNWIKK